MKKVIGLLVIIAVILIGSIIYADVTNQKMAAGNPYGKANLNPATLEQLNDPLYGNLILPDQLNEKLQNKEETYVYFYSPLCEHCKKTTPVLVPTANDMKVDVKKLNVLEFPDAWDSYKIEGTPTLIHFKDGKEVSRIVGENSSEEFKAWFEQAAKQ